ncbi:MAG TPA: AraC family transcriptional regulator [Gammaproteobacteria bacterium]
MEHSGRRTDYTERLSRVIRYIYDHLDEEIDLNKLAEVAHLSPYHWHRVYHALNGETIAATVKRLRLHRAAGYLAQTSMPIEEVAGKSGYDNLQSFTRVFKSVYGLPPAQYRKNGSHVQFQPPLRDKEPGMYDVTIKTIPAMKAVTIRHTGPYMQIGKAFDLLYGWLAARQRMVPGNRVLGIYYDDPAAVAEDQLRSRAGVVLNQPVAIEPPVEVADIATGPYAVLRHKGPYADMPAAYQWLYGTWLVQSGREAGDAPVFEEYLNNPRETPPTELLTDIYLPLRLAVGGAA